MTQYDFMLSPSEVEAWEREDGEKVEAIYVKKLWVGLMRVILIFGEIVDKLRSDI